MIVLVIELAIVGAMLAGMWKCFEKAGRPGWEGIVPIYNLYILTTKIIGRPVIWFIGCLIPLIGIVPAAILCIDTAKCFGKSTGYGVGLLLLGFVFWPMLGFSDARFTHVAPAAIPGVPDGVAT
jgi:hypothetical protein